MAETKIETPDEAYERVYTEVQKFHSYYFTWNEQFRCVPVCKCGGTSASFPDREMASEFMLKHATEEARLAAEKSRRTVAELAKYKEEKSD